VALYVLLLCLAGQSFFLRVSPWRIYTLFQNIHYNKIIINHSNPFKKIRTPVCLILGVLISLVLGNHNANPEAYATDNWIKQVIIPAFYEITYCQAYFKN